MILGLIYIATSKTSGKSYIGQTINLRKRKNQHNQEAHNKNRKSYKFAFHCAIRKYGFKDFTWKILKNNIPDGKLDIEEISLIKKYNTFKTGYNETIGGEAPMRNRKMSKNNKLKRSLAWINNNPMKNKEIVLKVRKALKGVPKSKKHRNNLSRYHANVKGRNNPNYGKIASEEKLNKMSNSAKKAWRNGKYSETIFKGQEKYEWKIINSEGEIFITTNLKKYCEGNNLHQSSMRLVAIGRQKQHKGFKCQRELL